MRFWQRNLLMRHAVSITALLSGPALTDEAVDEVVVPDGHFLIADIVLNKEDVFDLSNPEEDRWLYRAANRFHINTRESTIRSQLLFRSGDPYDKRVVDESARILRQNKYLYDADIRATRAANGTVDLVVSTRDVWSLAP